MNTTIRTRRTWLFLLPILVLCALTLLMSAQARGGSKIEDGWEYYPVTKTFEYQEQHPIGVRDAVITYKDNVIVGEQPHTFTYQDLEITGYGETTGEYSRLKLKDSHKITCLYDWSRRITGYGHGVIRTYWDQVLVPEDREFTYWDWTPAGTTTHYAVVADQKQTFDPASFSYTTWEQSADGKWQHVQKEQSYQVSRWYASEKELPYTVQEWEKTLKKVTYQVHRVEKVKKEVIGTWPILETYKIYLGQTKYVLENEYVRYSFETARIGTVWKTVDYATTVLGTEDKELHYGVEEIGTVDKQFDYEVMDRRPCEDCDPEVYGLVEEILRNRVDNVIGQLEFSLRSPSALSSLEELMWDLLPWSQSSRGNSVTGSHTIGTSSQAEHLPYPSYGASGSLPAENRLAAEGLSSGPNEFSDRSVKDSFGTSLQDSSMTLTPTFIRVLDENSTADAKGYGTHDDHIGGASRGESVSLGTSTNASGNARSASPSGRRSGKASAWVEWISNHLYGILVAAVSALLIGIVLWRYGALVLAILGRLLLYGTIIFVLWFLAQLLECIARLLEELGWCPELAKALRQKAEAFRRLMDTCMAGFARGAEIFLEALQGLLEWLKDKVAPASK